MTNHIELPVDVREFPYWRVNFRPGTYEKERIPTLGDCLRLVEHTKVRLRGWDYPHLSHRPGEQGRGNDWVASWSGFMAHREYWRMYQSGQFLHFFSVREAVSEGWLEQLHATARSHLGHLRDIPWDDVPGYLSVNNFLYTVTEIFEFAARLSQAQVYTDVIRIRIDLFGIRNFVLMPDWDRSWSEYRAATEDRLGHAWDVDARDLVAAAKDHSLTATAWFFERLGWQEPPLSVLERDQAKFLAGAA